MKTRIVLCSIWLLLLVFGVNANNSNGGAGDEKVLESAQFDGGQAALIAYSSTHLRYPLFARENALEGIVKVSFFVLADGKIHNPKIVKGMDPDCNESALEFIENMPAWKPAVRKGKPVASKIIMNVRFQLND